MASYKSRVIDVTIVNRLRNKGAILVEGAKWCGKTTTCEQHASSRARCEDQRHECRDLFA